MRKPIPLLVRTVGGRDLYLDGARIVSAYHMATQEITLVAMDDGSFQKIKQTPRWIWDSIDKENKKP